MTDETISVPWEDPSPVRKLVVCRAGERSVWIDYRAPAAGDGSQERPFQSLEEAYNFDSSSLQPETEPR